MSTAEKITSLEASVERDEREYDDAATPEDRRRLLLQAITDSRTELTALRASLASAPSAGIYISSCWSSNRIVSH